MAAKKYQVFVSSTFKDLIDERQDAIRSILDLKHIPAGMELFPAADIEQLAYIKKVIDECDYYLLIMGGRYGSMDGNGISYTEREYDYAVETGKIVLAFVHDNLDLIPLGKSDTRPEVTEALKAFRTKVMSGRLVRTWTTRENLEALILKALVHAFSDLPQVGWIRGDTAASEAILEQSNKILQENAELRETIKNLNGSQSKDFEDIADLSDKYEFPYIISIHKEYSARLEQRNANILWSAIFVILATNLNAPKTNSIILKALIEVIRLSGETETIETIEKLVQEVIKNQFIALGLISSSNIGVKEYIQLTEKGRRVYMENTLARKPKQKPPA